MQTSLYLCLKGKGAIQYIHPKPSTLQYTYIYINVINIYIYIYVPTLTWEAHREILGHLCIMLADLELWGLLVFPGFKEFRVVLGVRLEFRVFGFCRNLGFF